MRLNHADPLVAFLIRSLERAQYCRTISTEFGNVVEGVLEDLIQVLSDLGETEVSYEEAPDLTGVPLKTLQNRRIENVGSRRAERTGSRTSRSAKARRLRGASSRPTIASARCEVPRRNRRPPHENERKPKGAAC